MIPAVPILGSRIANVETDEAVSYLENAVETGSGGYVCLSNVHTTVTGVFDKEYRRVTNEAFMALPDGMPLVWALRLLGDGPSGRSNGPMLMEHMMDRAPGTGHRHFFFGGSEAVRNRLLERFQNHNVVGAYSPPFKEPTPEDDAEHARIINEASPDFLWVGLGAPKQEKWMARMRFLIKAPVMLGVGAAFDQLAGLKSVAPQWMQDRGLEWAYRLSQEPGRLGRRYFGTNPVFIVGLLGQVVWQRVLHRGSRNGESSTGS